MDPRRVGIYLEEVSLAEQLAGYWSRKAPQYRFLVFTGAAAVERAAAEEPLYLLITEEAVWAAENRKEAVSVGRFRIGRTVYLTEEREERRSGDGKLYVFRYQSADRILAEAMGMREDAACPGPESPPGFPEDKRPAALPGEQEVIGVYSPVGRCGKTRFALALGKLIGEQRKTLFLSLEIFSDFYGWLEHSGSGDISDLLYYLEQGSLTEAVWKKTAYPLQGLSVVAPAANPEDVAGLSARQCAALLEGAGRAGYRAIVLDIGSAHPDPAGLLALCSRVYVPVTGEETSRLKWQHFTTYLQKTGRERVLEYMETVRLPEAGAGYEAGGLPECGEELEQFVRRLLCLKN